MIVLDPTQKPLGDDASAGLPLAARLDTLDGKTIGLWNNQKLNAEKLLELIREELEERFSFEVVRGIYDPGRLMAEDEWGEADKCDAIILANGDCGACSTSGIANAIELEKRGIPAALISTIPFMDAVTTSTRLGGMPTIEWAIVDHPIGSLDDEELRQRARVAAEQVPGLLIASQPTYAAA